LSNGGTHTEHMQQPPSFAVTLPGGCLCVTALRTHRLHCLSLAGEFKAEVGAQIVQFPMGLAADGEHIFVADGFSNVVVKICLADGALVARAGDLDYPHGVALAGGMLFCADFGNHRVVAFSTGLERLYAFGSEGSAAGEFRYPRGLTAHDDLLYVADTDNARVQVFTLGGEPLRILGCTPERRIDSPCALRRRRSFTCSGGR